MAGNLVQGAVFTVMVVRAGMLRDPGFEAELAEQVQRSPRFFHDTFQALARTSCHQTKLRLAIRHQSGAYAPQSRILVGNPMQGIKRNCEIKLILEGKTTTVGHFESKIHGRGRRSASSE